MNKKQIIVALLVMGSSLGFVGIVFEELNWGDVFKGLYSGPALIMTALIIRSLYLIRWKMNLKGNKVKPLSSNLTIILNTIGVLLGMIFITAYFAAYFSLEKNNLLDIPTGLFLIFMFVVFEIIAFALNDVYFSDDSLFFNNGFSNKIVQLKDVISVDRFFLYAYRIRFTEKGERKEIIFIPHLSELIANPFEDVDSIRSLRSLLTSK